MSDRENELLETLENGLRVISEATGIGAEYYDRDQADIACYMDCFKDAAAMLKEAKFYFCDEGAQFYSEQIQAQQSTIKELEEKLKKANILRGQYEQTLGSMGFYIKRGDIEKADKAYSDGLKILDLIDSNSLTQLDE